jgi:hypothetical protein
MYTQVSSCFSSPKRNFGHNEPAPTCAPSSTVHHHPLDACYYSVMDEPQLSVNNLVSPW